jgi:PhzF family phenazine biosynthesis protein
MQGAAGELDASVTAFVERGVGGWSVRFFTRRIELPYCGHGILAAGRAVLDLSGADQARLRVGRMEIAVRREGGRVSARTEHPVELSTVRDRRPVLDCLVPRRGALSDRAVWLVSIGSPKWLVELESAISLYELKVDAERLALLSRERGVNGAYVYCEGSSAPGVDAEARAFNPATGAFEDSATGVGAGALAWLLKLSRPHQSTFVVRQGLAMGQDNRLFVGLGTDGSTEVGGTVTLG